MLLTTYHLAFATIATVILRRTTNLLKGLDNLQMDFKMYTTSILPIGFCFSASLILCNLAYLYLSVAYIQMLKSSTSVMVLVITWVLGVESPSIPIFSKVIIIVTGVAIASSTELQFNWIGTIIQLLGTFAEALRLVLVQQLMRGMKMDPLTSLYLYAPACALMNGPAFLYFELRDFSWAAFDRVGVWMFLANGLIAFGLNVALVFVLARTSSLVLCLTGVGKDILLILTSVVLFQTPLRGMQVFGYLMATLGLISYKQPALFDGHVEKIFLKVFPRCGASALLKYRKLSRTDMVPPEQIALSTQMSDDDLDDNSDTGDNRPLSK
ncbi:triose-phosphate transporter family-domain-containing protein [Phlyctochytrium arcticum]|nr:triose-phosphate transporter family-domain-containing protein [Phlyctochytrium arcticum]